MNKKLRLNIISGSILDNAEYYYVWLKGVIFGVTRVVHYLRNPNPHITVRLLRAFGAVIGEKTTFKRSVFIDNAFEDENSAGDFRYMKIGNNCYIGDCVYFDLSNEIIFEDNVIIAGRVSFVSHADCNRSKYLATRFPRKCAPIKVGEGAWIGFGAAILSGVEVGTQSIIAAKSLLLGNASANAVYFGVPAKKYKDI